jgi:hypothetical protein
MHGGFGSAYGEPIHHLDRGRHDAGADDVGHGGAGGADGVERGQQRLHALGPAQDAQYRLGDHCQRAFAANQQTKQVGTGRVGQRAADLD